MQDAAKKLDAAEQEMRQKCNQLQQSVQQLVGTSFKGAAANSFNQVMVRWGQDVEKLSQALREISQGMDVSAKRYEASDQEQQQQMNKIAQALG